MAAESTIPVWDRNPPWDVLMTSLICSREYVLPKKINKIKKREKKKKKRMVFLGYFIHFKSGCNCLEVIDYFKDSCWSFM